MADLIAAGDLQTYLRVGGLPNLTFTADETTIAGQVCSAASDAMKQACNRTFETQTAAVDRYFTFPQIYGAFAGNYAFYVGTLGAFPYTFPVDQARMPLLPVDDFFLTPDGAQTFGSITVTDRVSGAAYTPALPWPFNAQAKGAPYTALAFEPAITLPITEGQLKVHAQFGYVSVPAGVKNLCLMQAARWFKRPAAPFGVAGSDAMGNAMRLLAALDPDVQAMLGNYRRWWAAA